MSDPFLTSFPKNIPQIRYISQKMKEDKDGRYCELVGWLIPGDATDSRGIRRSGYDIYVWKPEYAGWTRVGFTDGIPTVGAAYVLLMREVNPRILHELLEQDFLPVIFPVGYDR